MPYAINKYNGTLIATVADGTIDNTTDLKIIGKNYAGYGEVQNENFLFLLENFANNNPPPRPISGQLWYDTTSGGKLKFYDGAKFRTTGGSEVGGTQPVGLTEGDFWWDSSNKQLYANNGSGYTLIGPQTASGQGTTQMRSRTVRDLQGGTHAIIEAVTNDTTVFVISTDGGWQIDQNSLGSQPITGFDKIKQGITLYDTGDTGVTTSNFRFWGTTSNSLKLDGLTKDDFVQANSPEFTGVVRFAGTGFTVGSPAILKVYNFGTTPTILNQANDTIQIQTTNGNNGTDTALVIKGLDTTPALDNVSNLGTALQKFKTIYAYTVDATALRANALRVGANYVEASTESVAGRIVARTDSPETINGVTITPGAIKGSYFVGTATSANYADLAEKYLADAAYDVGTVMMVGGEKEVTASQVGHRAIGAVSDKPAYLMNFELVDGTIVALKGRVPVKVNGNVVKGQRLVAGADGTAQAAMGNTADVFAIALETNDTPGIKLVECLIL